jgi:hypothetical protein
VYLDATKTLLAIVGLSGLDGVSKPLLEKGPPRQ